MTSEKLSELKNGFETAFIDGSLASNLIYRPQFISNNYREGKKSLFYKGLEPVFSIL